MDGDEEGSRTATTTTTAAAKPSALPTISELLPKAGLVYSEKSSLTEILCKPKIMPIKSAALERLEAMEAAAKAILSPTTTTTNNNTTQSRPGAAQSRSGRPVSARPVSAAGRARQIPPPPS